MVLGKIPHRINYTESSLAVQLLCVHFLNHRSELIVLSALNILLLCQEQQMFGIL